MAISEVFPLQAKRYAYLLGIDLLATAIRKLVDCDFFAWSRQILDVPGRTVSLNMLGVSVLVTDSPENTKAVLSTKVGAPTQSIAILILVFSLRILAKETLSTESGVI